MAVVNIRDANFIKLKSLKKEHLKLFCETQNIQFFTNITDTISGILDSFDNGIISTLDINYFIRNLYVDLRNDEMKLT